MVLLLHQVETKPEKESKEKRSLKAEFFSQVSRELYVRKMIACYSL